MKKILITIMTFAVIAGASLPALACGRNYKHKAKPHYTFVQKVQKSYDYYHNVLGMNLAHYLIQIKKMP
jgi:hypothetical protein